MNKVILTGNVGQMPQLRYTNTGIPVADFSLAVNERWTGSNGQANERTTWIKVTVWRGLAETVAEYLTKGRLVAVEGKLGELKPWTDRNGKLRCDHEVTASSVEFLGSNNEMSNDPHPYEAETATGAQQQLSQNSGDNDNLETNHANHNDNSPNSGGEAAAAPRTTAGNNNPQHETKSNPEDEPTPQTTNKNRDESQAAPQNKNAAHNNRQDSTVELEPSRPRLSADDIRKAAAEEKDYEEEDYAEEDYEEDYAEEDYEEEEDAKEEDAKEEMVEMTIEEIIQHDVNALASQGAEIIYIQGDNNDDNNGDDGDDNNNDDGDVKPPPVRRAKSKVTPMGSDAIAMISNPNGNGPHDDDSEDDDDLPF